MSRLLAYIGVICGVVFSSIASGEERLRPEQIADFSEIYISVSAADQMVQKLLDYCSEKLPERTRVVRNDWKNRNSPLVFKADKLLRLALREVERSEGKDQAALSISQANLQRDAQVGAFVAKVTTEIKDCNAVLLPIEIQRMDIVTSMPKVYQLIVKHEGILNAP